jgi:Zn-dependent protease with chaperone function
VSDKVMLVVTVATLVVVTGVVALVMWLESIPLRRLTSDAHWTERARCWAQVNAARQVMIGGLLAVSMIFTLDEDSLGWRGVLAVLLGFVVGPLLVLRSIPPAIAFRRMSLGQSFAWIGLVNPGVLMILPLMALTFNKPLDVTCAILALSTLLLLVAWTLGLNVWVLRSLGYLRPTPDLIVVTVTKLASETQTRVHRSWCIDAPMANALALPLSGDLVFTRSIIDLLSESELAGIIAHELGHLRESRRTQWMRMLRFVGYGCLSLIGPSIRTYGLGGGVICFATYLLITRLANAHSQRQEHAADAAGHAVSPEDHAYALALEKLHQINLIPALLSQQATHPNLYDRMVATGCEPSYPRPTPPGFRRPCLLGIVGCVMIFKSAEGIQGLVTTLMM